VERVLQRCNTRQPAHIECSCAASDASHGRRRRRRPLRVECAADADRPAADRLMARLEAPCPRPRRALQIRCQTRCIIHVMSSEPPPPPLPDRRQRWATGCSRSRFRLTETDFNRKKIIVVVYCVDGSSIQYNTIGFIEV